jgi:S1-C subfamily serine protease
MHSLLSRELAQSHEADLRHRLARPRLKSRRRGVAIGIAVLAASATVGVAGCGSSGVVVPRPVPSAPPAPLTAAQLREMVQHSIVRVKVHDRLTGRKAGGSGTYLGDGKVLTAAHVVDDAADIEVAFDKTVVTGQVLADDPYNDVALVKVDSPPPSAVPIKLGDAGQVSVGDRSLVLGFPVSSLTRSGQAGALRMTEGIVSAKGLRSRVAPDLPEYSNLIQVDEAINPGNSGGALINERGELIGIPVASNHETDENYAISIDLVKDLLPALSAGKSPASMKTSVLVFSREEMATILHLRWPLPTALVVGSFATGGGGDRAGLQMFDVILKVEGRPVRTIPQLNQVLQSHQRGDYVKLVVGRPREHYVTDVRVKLT